MRGGNRGEREAAAHPVPSSSRRDEERDRPPSFPPSSPRGLLAILCIWTPRSSQPPRRSPPSPPHSLSLPPTDPSAGFAERARSTCFASSYCFLYDKWPRGPLAGSDCIRLVSGPRWLSIDREGGAAKFERRTRRHLRIWFEENSGNGNHVCELNGDFFAQF